MSKLGHRPTLGDGLAEVAVQQRHDVPPQLHEDRLVEPGVLRERRRTPPRSPAHRAAALHGSPGITRARMNTDSTMPNSTGIDERVGG